MGRRAWVPVSYGEPHLAVAVMKAASELFGVGVEDLIGPSRRRPLCHQRQVAMAAMRALTGASYPTIGDIFDRKNETVVHACQRVEADPVLREMRGRLVELASGVQPHEPPDLAAEVERLRADVEALRAQLVANVDSLRAELRPMVAR